MKKILLAVLIILTLLALNYKFHLYDRFFNRDDFHFVTVKGTEFYFEGKPFRFIGANTRLIHGDKERDMVAEALTNAKDDGIRVIRQWAIGECQNDSTSDHQPVEKYYFQAGPGNWVEQSFVHFDKLLAEAGKQNIKVMVTLFNNWYNYGGMPMYVFWAGLSESPRQYAKHDTFYTHQEIVKWSKAFIHKMVTRTNSVTGIRYVDDPIIFSWELVNEVHAEYNKHVDVVRWTQEMAGYIKSLDQKHLVGTSFTLVDNMLERKHIINTFALPAIDYVDLHMYPAERWWGNMLTDETAFKQFVDDYTQIAHFAVKKPLVIGEVGFQRNATWLGKTRAELFHTLFQQSYEDGVSGVMVWSYSDPAWDDVYEINWRKNEHAKVCSLLAVYGGKFGLNQEPLVKNFNIGPEYGESFRVALKEHNFEVKPAMPELAENTTVTYQIPVKNYGKCRWTSFNYWDGDKIGFGSVYGKDAGYFSYPFYVDEDFSFKGIVVKVRLATTFAQFPGADSLASSDVTISIDNKEIATTFVRPQRFFGTLYEVIAESDYGDPVLFLSEGLHSVKFEVKETAMNKNGISIYGEAVAKEYEKDEIPIVLELVR